MTSSACSFFNAARCAAAAAALDVRESFDWQAHTARIERQLKTLLKPCAALRNVRDVRALGAVGVLEVERIPDPETVWKIVLETGVWLRPFDHFIYTMPPFVVTDDELARIAAAMERLADV